MSRDSSRKPSGSSSHSRNQSPTNSPSNFTPKRLTPNTTGNMLNVGVGGAANLSGYNSGWQVWGSASPSKLNPSQSTSVTPTDLSPVQPDVSHRGNLREGWTPSRPTSGGNWDEDVSNPHSQELAQMETQLPLNIHSTRQRNASSQSLSGSKIDHRTKAHSPFYGEHSVPKEAIPRHYPNTSPPFGTGFSGQQPGFPTGGHDPVRSSSVVDDLSIAIRGMAVEEDFSANREHGQLAQLPQASPNQGAQARLPPSIVQPRLPYGAYSNYYPPAPRDPYPEYTYGYDAYRGPTDPSMYGSPAIGNISAPSMFPSANVAPPNMALPDPHRQQQHMFYDYGLNRPPPPQQSQFFYPTHQPLIYTPGPPSMLHPPLLNPVAPLLVDKKREASYNMQQQLISQNPMFNALRTTPPPPHIPGYPPTLDFGAQMSVMLPGTGVYGPGVAGLQGYHPAMRRDGAVTFRSPVLEEFRTNKSRVWELKDIWGHIVEFSGDQHGSRFIQQKLETASSEEKQSVFDEIVPNNTLQLIQDVFGNYVIQKIFEHGTQVQKTRLANAMEGHVFPLSIQMYGCRVVQKAIECILPEQQSTFVRELEPHIQDCVRHAHGNHVIQKLIERVSPERLGFVSLFRGCVMDLATNSYGCRVLQRCLEHLPEDMVAPLLEELHRRAVQLMTDQYGNYVIQFIIEHGKPQDRALVISKLRGHLLELARHKFASNVCEKALVSSDTETRRTLVDEFLVPKTEGAAPVPALMKDQFGNYVLQRAVMVADADQRERLIVIIRGQIPTMRRYSSAYNKHLLSTLKQTSIFDHLTSSPAKSDSPSRTRSKRQSPSPSKSQYHRRVSDESEDDSSDIGAIKFEPIRPSSEDDEDEIQEQASAPKRRKIIVIDTDDSDGDTDILGSKVIKGKGKQKEKEKKSRIIRKRADSDSESEDVVLNKPKGRRKLVKGERPSSPPRQEESSDDDLDTNDILEDRFRARGQKTAYQKNLERLKRKKQGKPLESESEGEVSEVEDVTPFRGAKPHVEISDGSDDEEEDEDQNDDRMSEDDFIVEDDGAPTAELPTEFSMETHQDLSHQFKKVFQFFVHLATRELSDRHDFMFTVLESEEYFSVPLKVFRRKLFGLRDSLVASSVWRPYFKRALEKHPDFDLLRMDFAVPGCDACHLGARMSTFQARLTGKGYDPVGYGTLSDSDDEDEDGENSDDGGMDKTEFHLGRFCARRTRVYHDISHWEYTLFKSVDQEVRSIRGDEDRAFVRVAFAGGKKPPKDTQDADAICDWLDERRVIDLEWQRLKGIMDNARNLEMMAKKGQDVD
ncbi:mRNA binding protein puf3 [Marasmius tenuissimus]|nr:mRNA binding protein puf3 [Marasmius tenuissimus]